MLTVAFGVFLFFGKPRLGMFSDAWSFQGIGVDTWDTSQVTKMQVMFQEALIFDANLSQWDTSSVLDFTAMFSVAKSFRGVGVNNWDTSQAESTGKLTLAFCYYPSVCCLARPS